MGDQSTSLTTRPVCRGCSAALPPPFLDLGLQPLSNAFIAAEDLRAGAERPYPLQVRLCPVCSLVQADDAVSPSEIFDDSYAYYSSYSSFWLEHAEAFARSATSRFALSERSLVIEVASNDGYLLQFFARTGIPVLGIEPASGAATVARSRGIPTETVFFNRATAQDLAARGVSADLVHGANVLAHVPDLRDFLGGFSKVLKPGGTLTLEFPHLLELISGAQFDTIYHEHFSYLSLAAAESALRSEDLAVYDLDQLSTHGGSLRLYCCRAGESRQEAASIGHVRRLETLAQLRQPATFYNFGERVHRITAEFFALVTEIVARKKVLAAYGAAAKGNTFLNTCKLGPEHIRCAFDRNPLKQGKLLPGSHIPVFSPERIRDLKPDYILILPWNIRDEIASQLSFISEWGGQFVVAIPNLQVFAP